MVDIDYRRKMALSLKEVKVHVRKDAKLADLTARTVNNTSNTLKKIIGLKKEPRKAERLEKLGTIMLTFPADPSGMTYVIGAALYGSGRAVKSIEMKNMGIRDIIRIYRRLGIELSYLLK